MRSVGARELKQHTGEIIARVVDGEKLLLTVRGKPVAVISPIDQEAVDAAISREVERAEEEGWLAAAEGAFGFWDNTADSVWDQAPVK